MKHEEECRATVPRHLSDVPACDCEALLVAGRGGLEELEDPREVESIERCTAYRETDQAFREE